MTTTRKSVVYSALANFGSIATSLVLVVVVARWLFPAEIGAFAVAYAVIALLDPLRQAQLIAYVIQAKTLNNAVMRGVSYVGWVATAFVVAVSIAAGFAMIGPFEMPEAGTLLLIMTGGLVASTIAQPAFAVLNREMRFGLITVVELAGAVTKAVVTIGMLMGGWRAEALAVGVLAEFAIKIAYVFTVERGYAFALPSREGSGPIWSFCLKLTGAQFLNRASISASDLLIGSFLGLAAAGIYNRSAVLVRTMRSGIEKAIMPVALAVFAKSNRKDRSLARSDYLTGVSMLTGVTWSALAVFIAIAEPLIMTAYGERWAATIPLAMVLAGGGILHATTAMVPSLLASIGEVDSLFKRNLMIQIPRLAILIVTVQYDLTTVVWGAFASMLIHFAVNQQLLVRQVDIGFGAMISSLWRSAAVASLSALAALLVLQTPILSAQSYPVQLVAGLGAAGVIWLTTLFALRHPLHDEFLGAIQKVRSLAVKRK